MRKDFKLGMFKRSMDNYWLSGGEAGFKLFRSKEREKYMAEQFKSEYPESVVTTEECISHIRKKYDIRKGYAPSKVYELEDEIRASAQEYGKNPDFVIRILAFK